MDEHTALIDAAIADFRIRITFAATAMERAQDPQEFAACERHLHELSRAVADRITEKTLRAMCEDEGRMRAAAASVRATGSKRGVAMKSEGRRETVVRLLGGTLVTLRTSYMRARPRAKTAAEKRGSDGTGVYPLLDSLGISDRATPALRLRVAHAVCEANSVIDARELMSQAGLVIDHKAALRLTYSVTDIALAERSAALRSTKAGVDDGEFAGMRVVACIDGGRTLIRKALRGRPRKGGRRRFQTDWREPKVLCVYVIDAAGERVKETRTVHDGTLGDADAAFELLLYHLRCLGVHKAKHLALLADGAKWIWNRTGALVEALGIDQDRVTEIVDHYHVVERLHEFGGSRGWSKSQTKKWVSVQKKRLKRGWVERIEKDVASRLTDEERESGTELAYWTRNQHRLRYAAFRKLALPIGGRRPAGRGEPLDPNPFLDHRAR